jgi:quinol monooxygenase YgiN
VIASFSRSPAPFIFIGTHSIKEGKLEEFKQYCQEFCRFVEANEPRLLGFELYINQDGTEVSVLQIHPDVASMEFHVQVTREHFAQAYEYLDTTRPSGASRSTERPATPWCN